MKSQTLKIGMFELQIDHLGENWSVDLIVRNSPADIAYLESKGFHTRHCLVLASESAKTYEEAVQLGKLLIVAVIVEAAEGLDKPKIIVDKLKEEE